MKKGEVLYKHVKITEDTPLVKLSITDMLRAIVEKMNYDPANIFKSDNAYSEYMFKLQANLTKFLTKSIKPIKDGTKKDVLVKLSSEFTPVYKKVKTSRMFKPYYTFKESFPDVIYPGVPYTFRVLIKRKTEEERLRDLENKEEEED